MIIAVDFDGVLCESRFPEIGPANDRMVSAVQQLIGAGHEVILWTCRTGDRLTEALEWCGERGLEFCAVNRNAPSNRERFESEYPQPSPKVYADLYVEDHDVMWRRADRLYGVGFYAKDAMGLAVYELERILEREEFDNE